MSSKRKNTPTKVLRQQQQTVCRPKREERMLVEEEEEDEEEDCGSETSISIEAAEAEADLGVTCVVPSKKQRLLASIGNENSQEDVVKTVKKALAIEDEAMTLEDREQRLGEAIATLQSVRQRLLNSPPNHVSLLDDYWRLDIGVPQRTI
ncbi:unnamed protein product [Dimorphilus gyrociliatus]|uniref:Uncharacterized protein n=1 Tax=Dimorphilus gyrociliatus TaxID=2664684 RepID=A0A7I8WB82_9ANNE|nr:unnamed protein product [Dimorphilus gyrociliatus]